MGQEASYKVVQHHTMELVGLIFKGENNQAFGNVTMKNASFGIKMHIWLHIFGIMLQIHKQTTLRYIGQMQVNKTTVYRKKTLLLKHKFSKDIII